MKARYEEAKFRDLDPRSTSGSLNTRGTTIVRQDVQTPPRNRPNQVNMARKCWVCHQVGHVAKACPQQRRGQPVEAPGRQQSNRSTTTCVTGKTNLTEIQAALDQKTATMHVLQPYKKGAGPTLGPAVSVEPKLEGQPVKALEDTGSPITIVSVDCMLDVLAKNRRSGQAKEEWREEVEKRFLPPTLSINNYGGGEVNIIGQITVTLSHGDKECETTILVQKGASLSLLLGTDMLPSLGFYVVYGAGPGPMQELLQGKMWDHIDDSPKSKLRVEAPSFTPVQGKPAGNMPGDNVQRHPL